MTKSVTRERGRSVWMKVNGFWRCYVRKPKYEGASTASRTTLFSSPTHTLLSSSLPPSLPPSPGTFARTSGGYAVIVAQDEDRGTTKIRLPSGAKKTVSSSSRGVSKRRREGGRERREGVVSSSSSSSSMLLGDL